MWVSHEQVWRPQGATMECLRDDHAALAHEAELDEAWRSTAQFI